MKELALANRVADWRRLKSLVLESVSSPITKRVYNLALDEFIAWYAQEPRPPLTKATVAAWRVALEARGPGSGLYQRPHHGCPETGGRGRRQWAAKSGVGEWHYACERSVVQRSSTGNWLTVKQAQALLNAPDIMTKKGLRDRGILAVLLGRGLRRSEVAALRVAREHRQQRGW